MMTMLPPTPPPPPSPAPPPTRPRRAAPTTTTMPPTFFFTRSKMKKNPVIVTCIIVVVLLVHCCIVVLVRSSTNVIPHNILSSTKGGRTITELGADANAEPDADAEPHRPLDDSQQQQHRSNSQQQSSNSQQQQQQQRPYFIFHLGPHKTGTSEIQCELSYMRRFLSSKFNVTYIGKLYESCLDLDLDDDGHEHEHKDKDSGVSDSMLLDDSMTISTPELVECLDKYQYDCHTQPVWKKFRSVLEHVRNSTSSFTSSSPRLQQHILMSDEKFSRIRLLYDNVNNKISSTDSGNNDTDDNNTNNNNNNTLKVDDGGIRLLYETIAEEFGYEIKLVFVYRHYYAWFYSLYNEKMKKIVSPNYDDDVHDQKGEEESAGTKLITWGQNNVVQSISDRETDTTVIETQNSNHQSDVVVVDGRKHNNNTTTYYDSNKNLQERRKLKQKTTTKKKLKTKKRKKRKRKQKYKPGTPVEPFVEYYRRFDDDRRKKNQTLILSGGDGREREEKSNSTEQNSSSRLVPQYHTRLDPQYLRFANQKQIHPVSFLQRWWTLQGIDDGDDDDKSYLPYVPDPKRGDVILINMHESEIIQPPSNKQHPQNPRVVGQTGDLVIDFIRQALAPLQLSPSFIETEIINFKRRYKHETENKKESRQQKHRQLQLPSKTNPSIDLNYDLLTYTAAQDGFRFVPEHIMRSFRRDVVTRYTQHNFLSSTKIDPSTIPLRCLRPDEIQDMCDVSFKMMTQLVDEQQANVLIPSSTLQPTGSGKFPPLFKSSSSSSSLSSSSLSGNHDWSDHHNKTFFESFIDQKKNHCQWDVTVFLNTSQDAQHFFRSIESSNLTSFLI